MEPTGLTTQGHCRAKDAAVKVMQATTQDLHIFTSKERNKLGLLRVKLLNAIHLEFSQVGGL